MSARATSAQRVDGDAQTPSKPEASLRALAVDLSQVVAVDDKTFRGRRYRGVFDSLSAVRALCRSGLCADADEAVGKLRLMLRQGLIERVSKKARSGDKDSVEQKELFERAKAMLENGDLLRAHGWTEREAELLKPLCLMTTKRMLYVANVSDDDLDGGSEYARAVAKRAADTGSEWIAICGDIESELRNMEADERDAFMEDLGIEKLGLDRLIQATYTLLGLQTYYTAGEKEIRAWTTSAGSKAPEAAGVIHTDFEKAFIRAEVYSVPDLVEHESETAIRAAGKLRTEGRDYVMREGDVCHFLIGK